MIEFKIAKQLRPVVLLSLAVVLLVVCHAEGNHSTNSKLKIDRDTTFLTGPLRTAGTVDYASGINARMKQGVTPEKNVCVLLCEAIQPLEAWDMPADFLRKSKENHQRKIAVMSATLLLRSRIPRPMLRNKDSIMSSSLSKVIRVRGIDQNSQKLPGFSMAITNHCKLF